MISTETNAAVYVGTYHKYNSGSIEGKWLTITDYADKGEFLEACRELHIDEADPEFMFQDYDGFPERFYDECFLDDELWEYLEAIEGMDDDEREAFEIFCDELDGQDLDGFRDAYRGQWNSETDYAEELADEMGFYDAMDRAGICRAYFDAESFARDLFICDYYFSDGHVFSRY